MWERWPNFSPEEMACKDGTPYPLNDETIHFMDQLQALRNYLLFALPINSAYRTDTYNALIKGAKGSAHLLGLAVDIAAAYENAYHIVINAPKFGFTGIGVNQKGLIKSRFIHLDMKRTHIRPRVWSY